MPLCVLDIKKVILEIFDVLQILNEKILQLLKVKSNLRALSATKDWHSDLGALSGEL